MVQSIPQNIIVTRNNGRLGGIIELSIRWLSTCASIEIIYSVHTESQIHLREIRWPKQHRFANPPLGTTIQGNPIHGPITWNISQIRIYSLRLQLWYWHICRGRNSCGHRHHVTKPPSVASFIWRNRQHWHRHFCADHCLRYNSIHHFWFYSACPI